MDKITIILNDGPSSMRTWNGLRVVEGAVGSDMEVDVFLLDASVYAVKKGQNPPNGLSELNLADKFDELIKLGVTVTACGTCVEAGGLKKEEMVDGITVGSIIDLCDSIKGSSNVMVF